MLNAGTDNAQLSCLLACLDNWPTEGSRGLSLTLTEDVGHDSISATRAVAPRPIRGIEGVIHCKLGGLRSLSWFIKEEIEVERR